MTTDTEIKAIIAQNVRRLRAERMWSQEMLAHFAGLHPTEVSRLERGLRTPRITTLVNLARALGCTVDDLVAGASVAVAA